MENSPRVMCFGFDILIYGAVLQLHSCELIFHQDVFYFAVTLLLPCLHVEENESHQVRPAREDKCLHVLDQNHDQIFYAVLS